LKWLSKVRVHHNYVLRSGLLCGLINDTATKSSSTFLSQANALTHQISRWSHTNMLI